VPSGNFIIYFEAEKLNSQKMNSRFPLKCCAMLQALAQAT